MGLASVLLHLAIFVHIKLAVMQKPTTGNDNNPTEFNIGGVLSNKDSEDHFRDTIAVSWKVSRLLHLMAAALEPFACWRCLSFIDASICINN